LFYSSTLFLYLKQLIHAQHLSSPPPILLPAPVVLPGSDHQEHGPVPLHHQQSLGESLCPLTHKPSLRGGVAWVVMLLVDKFSTYYLFLLTAGRSGPGPQSSSVCYDCAFTITVDGSTEMFLHYHTHRCTLVTPFAMTGCTGVNIRTYTNIRY